MKNLNDKDIRQFLDLVNRAYLTQLDQMKQVIYQKQEVFHQSNQMERAKEQLFELTKVKK